MTIFWKNTCALPRIIETTTIQCIKKKLSFSRNLMLGRKCWSLRDLVSEEEISHRSNNLSSHLAKETGAQKMMDQWWAGPGCVVSYVPFFPLSKPILCVEIMGLGVDMAPLSSSSQHYRDLSFLMSTITASLVWIRTAFFLPLPLWHAYSVHMPETRGGWRMSCSTIPHLIQLRQGRSLHLRARLAAGSPQGFSCLFPSPTHTRNP